VLKRVLTAVVLVPVVLLIVFRAPLWLFAAVVAMLALQTLREYLDIIEKYEIRPFRTVVFAFAVVAFCGAILVDRFDPYRPPLKDMSYFGLLLGLAVLVILVVAMARQDLRTALPSAATSLLGMLYVVLPLIAFVSLREGALGWFSIVLLLVVVWVGDIAAYFVGRSVGKHKLAPQISPNKSWEGAIASTVTAVAAALVLFRYHGSIENSLYKLQWVQQPDGWLIVPPIWQIAAVAAALNIAAQLGDLVESMMKRGAGIKDSGSILPGHGGMLDRIDALLFAAPVMWYYVLIATGFSR
jgi:phosphatidate cytidylyltransferase